MTSLVGRFVVDRESGCWLWQRSLNSNGYGKFKRQGREVYAHRVAYEERYGPIPDGLTIDHLCRVRHCCNPSHLQAVTLGENIRRSPRAHKEHCSRGHPLQGGNLYIDPKGFRKCRTCKRSYRTAQPGRTAAASGDAQIEAAHPDPSAHQNRRGL